MSKEKSNFEHKVMDWAGVPKDVEPGVPVLTVTGRTDLCLENYKGILEYTDSLIRIKIPEGVDKARCQQIRKLSPLLVGKACVLTVGLGIL